jgi:hypothetical protein
MFNWSTRFKNKKLTKKSPLLHKVISMASDPRLIILLFCVLANVLNVGLLWNYTYLSFWIACLELVVIWSLDLSDYGIDRRSLIMASVVTAINGPLLENIMIYLSGDRCWVYGNPYRPLRTALDLIPGYGLMGASGIIMYKLLEHLSATPL